MMEKRDENKVNLKEERRKLIGISLIVLILIMYVITLLGKIYNKSEENGKQTRVEQIIKELEDEYK